MAPPRVVVVVPRQEAGLHEYLQRSLACVKDVEVVLERRTVAVTPRQDRRRQAAQGSERKILLCSLVDCPTRTAAPPPATPEPPADVISNTRRTLLWPALRLEHL